MSDILIHLLILAGYALLATAACVAARRAYRSADRAEHHARSAADAAETASMQAFIAEGNAHAARGLVTVASDVTKAD